MGPIVVQVGSNPACNRMRAASAAEGRQPRSRTRVRASRGTCRSNRNPGLQQDGEETGKSKTYAAAGPVVVEEGFNRLEEEEVVGAGCSSI